MTDQERRVRDQLAEYQTERRAGRNSVYPLGALMAAYPAKLRADFKRRFSAWTRERKERR